MNEASTLEDSERNKNELYGLDLAIAGPREFNMDGKD